MHARTERERLCMPPGARATALVIHIRVGECSDIRRSDIRRVGRRRRARGRVRRRTARRRARDDAATATTPDEDFFARRLSRGERRCRSVTGARHAGPERARAAQQEAHRGEARE